MTTECPVRLSPEEERQLLAALNAEIPAHGAEAGSERARGLPELIRWLGEVYRRYGRSEPISKIAAYLAVLEPDDEEVKLRRIVKGTHISTREVEKALDVLLADGFVDIRPAIRIEAVRLKLLT